jgi:hypothetical protein
MITNRAGSSHKRRASLTAARRALTTSADEVSGKSSSSPGALAKIQVTATNRCIQMALFDIIVA